MSDEFQESEMSYSTPQTVLITGASSGIGRACALWMDRAGWHVIATVRQQEDARQLHSDASDRLRTVLLDVTDAEQIAETARMVGKLVGSDGLHGLVNNAGIAGGGLLEYVDPDDLRRILDVNTVAPVAVTQALIPLLRRAQGCIVMISSEAGFSSTPLASPYCASKFALEALTDGLRLELRPWGINVVSVQPGVIKTAIWDKARAYAKRALSEYPARAFDMYGPLLGRLLESLEETRGIEPDGVARTVHMILTTARPKARYLVGRDAVIRRWVERLPTGLRDRLILSKMPKYGTANPRPVSALQEVRNEE